MGEYKHCGIEGFLSHTHVHGNKEAAKYQDLLGKSMVIFPLRYHFKHYEPRPLHVVEEMSSYYKSNYL